MSNTMKRLVGIGLFLFIFIILLLIGTFYDLKISEMLASGSLSEGSYYSTNVFGRFFEYFGSYPIFVFGVFACLVFMHKIYHLDSKLKYLSLIFIVLMVVLSYWGIKDTVKYAIAMSVITISHEATIHPNMEKEFVEKYINSINWLETEY